MVLVVSQRNLPKPCTDFGRAMMLPALKLSLNDFQLCYHPLLRRDPPDDESSVGELPTEVGEAQESEGSWFPSPRCFRSRAAKRPNSISRVLSQTTGPKTALFAKPFSVENSDSNFEWLS